LDFGRLRAEGLHLKNNSTFQSDWDSRRLQPTAERPRSPFFFLVRTRAFPNAGDRNDGKEEKETFLRLTRGHPVGCGGPKTAAFTLNSRVA
jgi:hypothetical protein